MDYGLAVDTAVVLAIMLDCATIYPTCQCRQQSEEECCRVLLVGRRGICVRFSSAAFAGVLLLQSR